MENSISYVKVLTLQKEIGYCFCAFLLLSSSYLATLRAVKENRLRYISIFLKLHWWCFLLINISLNWIFSYGFTMLPTPMSGYMLIFWINVKFISNLLIPSSNLQNSNFMFVVFFPCCLICNWKTYWKVQNIKEQLNREIQALFYINVIFLVLRGETTQNIWGSSAYSYFLVNFVAICNGWESIAQKRQDLLIL